MFRRTLSAALVTTAVSVAPAMAQEGYAMVARAEVLDTDGTSLGTVTINATASGIPLVIVALNGLPEGSHGIHLHEIGDCSAPDFSSAGGHIAGDAEHGVFVEGGPHPGDLPNAIVNDNGALDLELFVARLDIRDMIMDEDGAAFVVHRDPDDYYSQPSGDSGDRIACGAFEEV